MVFSISLLSRNEEDVGKAIMKSGIPRDQIFVTTKVSTSSVSLVHNVFSEGLERFSWKGKYQRGTEPEPETVEISRISLKFLLVLYAHCRLGLGYVDLYLMHSPLGGKVVETWQAMVELQQQGLAKSAHNKKNTESV